MKNKDYDFSGYVTKSDILCSDGVVIKKDAFNNSDGRLVPLVWNHDYGTPRNVLGNILLKNRDSGIYGYGYFNSTEEALSAKEMVRHGDITSMSIGARKIKKEGNNVVHGDIYEVSLVLAGANPGASIDYVMNHNGDESDDRAHIYTGNLIHFANDESEEEEVKITREELEGMNDKELEEYLNGLTGAELDELSKLLGVIEEPKEEDASEEPVEEEEDTEGIEEESVEMKHNIFSNTQGVQKMKIEDQRTLLQSAIDSKAESMQDVLKQAAVDPATLIGGTDFGVTNIEYLFPDVANVEKTPKTIMDQNTAYGFIINGVRKLPFSKIKTRYFDLDINDEKQRAKGYAKGKRKVDEVIKVLKRETYPKTIYKKQQLDRDDVIEITDFDIVASLNAEMRMMLEIEIARAILIGDGRDESSEQKIDEDSIRPIMKDDDIYAIKKTYTDPESVVESVINAMTEYKGSGSPTMFIDPRLLAQVKLLKGTDGRYLSGRIPTDSELAEQMGVSGIKSTSFLKDTGAIIIVSLNDYAIGSTKGGQITSFSDFDIDFNRYKYLIETRLSGALMYPMSAVVLTKVSEGEDSDEEA